MPYCFSEILFLIAYSLRKAILIFFLQVFFPQKYIYLKRENELMTFIFLEEN